ncbi:MAG: aminotransferase class I/II-fold pyridoxal phosphate-dependent enzyme [Flavobacteriaceae bacterium]|nr:aminotransferase class I/II-fold pyridoxal phosphate-dependent enzyme [Flavobacteriaceae bacterium]
MKNFNPIKNIEKFQHSGHLGGINPPISDSSTYTFADGQEMLDTFEGKVEDKFLYSRHLSPSNLTLSDALASMEGAEAGNVTASGMGAITSVLLELCEAGDHIVSSRTVYGGTYAFLKNFAKKLSISTTFVDATSIEKIKEAITPKTKVIYCETLSNPLLEVANISAISALAKERGITLVVDNTFSPLLVSPIQLGADVVIHSLTKFINGASDTVGGVVCGTQEFINRLRDVNTGAGMLLGMTMDSLRSASIMKNLQTLPLRMKQHSKNALYLAEKFEKDGFKTAYPGLSSHPNHELAKKLFRKEIGFGGIVTVDMGSFEKANKVMALMQKRHIGYLAVSLGFYKTLFSAPGTSTSSEIPEEEQKAMGLSDGLVRFSIGLDCNIEETYEQIKTCMSEVL